MNHWRDEGFRPMSTFSSHKIPRSTPYSSHSYIDIVIACKHNYCARQRGLNVRPDQKYLASNSPVRVKIRLDSKLMKYKLVKLVDEHNHHIDSEFYSRNETVRRPFERLGKRHNY